MFMGSLSERTLLSNPDFSYVARQPIVDSKHNIVAYELLYRNGEKNSFPDIAADEATQKLFVEQLLIGQSRILGDRLGFVNFDLETLKKRVPFDFPHERYVIEVLESCEPTDELYALLIELKGAGFQLALDDFVPSNKWRKFFPIIDIIKFDIHATSLSQCEKVMNALHMYDIQYLAEKVETYDEFEQARKLGFQFFQGYYFKKPEMMKYKKLNSSLSTSVRLCEAVAQSPIDIDRVEQIICGDTSISFQLLNFVNTSASVRSEIKSFRQAIVYLGEERIRKFASYAAFSSLNPEKPIILLRYALHRARCFELLLSYTETDPKAGFLCGMLSLMDAMLDSEMSDIVSSLKISSDIKAALLERKGILGELILLAQALEEQKWEDMEELKMSLDIDDTLLMNCNTQAASWIDELFENTSI